MSKKETVRAPQKLVAPAGDIYQKYPVRKTKAQKEAFRNDLLAALQAAGWNVHVENSGRFLQSCNVVAGNPRTAGLVLTAHYDTPAVMPFPNLMAPGNIGFFILYQLFIMAAFLAFHYLVLVAGIALAMPFIIALYTANTLLLVAALMIMVGPANRHNANDNTSGVMTLLQTALTLPVEQRGSVCLVFFDNEELGMVGSGAFRRKHGKLPDALLLNFDCVSDGGHLMFYPSKAVRSNAALCAQLEEAFAAGAKSHGKMLKINTSPFFIFPSDQMQFHRTAAVCALHKKPLVGYCVGRIHTPRDVVFDEENILALAEGNVALAQALVQAGA